MHVPTEARTLRGTHAVLSVLISLALLTTASPASAQKKSKAKSPAPAADAAPKAEAKPDAKTDTKPAAAGEGAGKKAGSDATAAAEAEEDLAPLLYVDQDKDRLPTPVVHSFRAGSAYDGKLGIGFLYGATQPFGATQGYANFFSEGDWSIFNTGLSLHHDIELRGGLGFLERRNPDLQEGQASRYDDVQTFATGRTTDYSRIDRLHLSYDVAFFGVDFGRSRVVEAASQIVDGVQLRLDFDVVRIGLFGGIKPNPWHQQVVGAASGGFLPVEILAGRFEVFPAAWGKLEADPKFACGIAGETPNSPYSGETIGPYSNEIGLPLLGACSPWLNLGSYRFQTLGLWGALNYKAAAADVALVVDTFVDPSTEIRPAGREVAPNVLAPGAATGLQDGGTGFSLDRLWFYTHGAIRIMKPMTLSWRGTVDILGAKPIWPRDLFVNLSYRNLGPLSLSGTAYKVNTHATAISYGRFFRPLERVDEALDPSKARPNNVAVFPNGPVGAGAAHFDKIAGPPGGRGVNNAQLYVVDRDRLSLNASLNLFASVQAYVTLMAERRGDFAYTPADQNFGAVFTGLSDYYSTTPQWVPRCVGLGGVTEPGVQNGPAVFENQVQEIQGINATVPVHLDPCKLGATFGVRDSFLAGYGFFDVHLTHMRGYFSNSTRVSGLVGVTLFDRISADIGGAYERNENARVYQPALECETYLQDTPDYEGCSPNQNPQNIDDAVLNSYRMLPSVLSMYELRASVMAQVVGPWYLEASYFGFLEDLPFQGDYGLGNGVFIERDTFQLTHTVFMRSVVRF